MIQSRIDFNSKVMLSICFSVYRGGEEEGVPQTEQGYPPSPSLTLDRAGYESLLLPQTGQGYPRQNRDTLHPPSLPGQGRVRVPSPPPRQDRGTPPSTRQAMQRAVCLLRSRRRTFLCLFVFWIKTLIFLRKSLSKFGNIKKAFELRQKSSPQFPGTI